jgi:phage tail protein X
MRFVCWIVKARSENVILVIFTAKNGYAKAHQYIGARTLLVLFPYITKFAGILKEQ